MQVLYLDAPDPDDLAYLRSLLPAEIRIDTAVLHDAGGAEDAPRVAGAAPAGPLADTILNDGTSVADPAATEVVIGGRVPEGALEAMPRLRYWIVPYAGIPMALRRALESRPDLVVLNSHHNASDVAEHAWALLLAAAKRLIPCHDALKRGDWSPRHEPPSSVSLRGRALLLIGYGAIGRAVAPIARAFGMRVVAVRRRGRNSDRVESRSGASRPDQSSGCEPPCCESPPNSADPASPLDFLSTREDLPDLLPAADAILLCLPATPATDGLLGPAEFARMKRGVLLVNVGRGAAIQEDAFFAALGDGTIGAAGIDTWWSYPDPARPETTTDTPPSRFELSSFDNLVFSPHRASHTAGSERARMASLAEILRSIASGEPTNRVDRDRWY